MPKPVSQPEWTSARSKLFVIFGLFGLGLIFALAYILGQTSKDTTQRNLEEKLVLVRQKVASCQQERDVLRQKNVKVAANTKSAAYKLQKENDDLAEENNQLMEDNESLREEKTILEETISELRYELDMKDVINDDEKAQLQEYKSSGNVSKNFLSFLSEQDKWGTVDKDSLISKLISELKVKKTQLQKCKSLTAAATPAAATAKVA
eukprot:NODE_1400_length_933_cov_908.753394_g1079_i0.p1 GENE.NODE_1400_length_933_cov_908.753394_g1079_i0~~NODE_1400_length_933_cov_908.753394_g1079_i0.p1  ORF type:complete len:207 (+),score=67.82 NODE_1400_length_933_cov_908.753394_g1079_i0:82-702(+)